MTPDTNGSWVALYAKTMESKTFQHLTCAERSVFLQGLLLAARTEYDCSYHGRFYHLLPGQFVISLRDFVTRCGSGCTLKIVRTTIDKLVADHTWTQQRAQQGAQSPSLVTFTNWGLYQRPLTDRAQSRAQSRAQQGHTDGMQHSMNGSKNTALHSSYTDTIEDIQIRPRKRTEAGEDPVVAAYRRICIPAGMPDVIALTPARERAIAAAMKTYGLERLEQLFAKVTTSAFLTGKVASTTHPGWRADFDFILKPDTLVHIAEGSRYFSDRPARPARADDFRRPLGTDRSVWANAKDSFPESGKNTHTQDIDEEWEAELKNLKGAP